MIGFETARDIAFAYREIEAGEEVLKQITEAREKHVAPDIRDAFGRRQNGLQLGIPSGEMSHRMFGVSWDLSVPIVEAHIAASRARIGALSAKARIELGDPDFAEVQDLDDNRYRDFADGFAAALGKDGEADLSENAASNLSVAWATRTLNHG